jgi:hypothetical protein
MANFILFGLLLALIDVAHGGNVPGKDMYDDIRKVINADSEKEPSILFSSFLYMLI